MKHGLKKRILSLVLCISMVLPMAAVPMPVYSVENEESIAPLSNPFTPETIITLPDGTTTKSQSYRIPSMVTLADGTIVAAADIRWNTTYDGGGLDTLVARSTDDGQTWSYTVANYLGDNGNVYNGSHSTAFLDPSLLVAADGKTVYMLVDLYPYGVALNGDKDSNNAYVHTQPSTDVGFNDAGYLKLSDNNHTSYDYYLKDSKIYTSNHEEVSGYTVDPYFNITGEDGTDSNLFFENSPFKVVRTGYLYLTKSTNGGETWSVPQLLNVKTTSERVCLVAPGNSITTSNDTMIFPVYSYHGDNAATGNTQRLSFLYSTDGVDWKRTEELNAATAGKLDKNWASEAAVVELQDGTLRFFIRNGSQRLQYVDYTMGSGWGTIVTMDNVKTNSNTQISAITYSRTVNGKKVILVSCPTGPDRNGSNESGAGKRLNGSIFVFTVNATGEMTLKNTLIVNDNDHQFMYSCLIERADGAIAILYEDNENAWGTGDSCYYEMSAKAYSADAFGLQFDVEANAIYEELMDITAWEEWEEYVSGLDDDELLALQSLPQEQLDELERVSYYFYKEKVLSMAPAAVDYTDAAPFVSLSDRNSKAVVASSEEVSPFAHLRSSTLMSTRANIPSLLADAEENGLILNKKAEKEGDKYKITLEAYTTGSVQAGEATPSDIILVLDLSTSMDENFSESSYVYTEAYPSGTNGSYYLKNGQRVTWCNSCDAWTYGCGWFIGHIKGTAVVPKTSSADNTEGRVQFYTRETVAEITRLEALKSAMQSFIAQVADQPTDDRIALVGFHENSVLLVGNSNATAFMDATTYETTLINAISNLDYYDLEGATEHGFGMERAVAVFNEQTTDYTNRNKVVIMVTDGEPAPSGTNNWSSRTVKQAIEQSYILKSTYGASVYTISVMPGTDASNPTTAMDKYMDYLSSNYPNARYTAASIDNRENDGYSYYSGAADTIVNAIVPGTKVETTGSYYLTAGNLEALNSIFGEIAAQTGGASINLDTTTQIKDIVSPYFVLPDGATAANIAVSTMDAVYTDGVLGWKASTIQGFDPTVTVEGKNVTVSGFDYTHNFVAETGRLEGDVSQAGAFHGRKLIITFYVTPETDFLGGDGVVTNDVTSGVYDKDGNMVEAFEVPTVNVPLKAIDTVAQDKHIYYGNTTDLTGILNLKVTESDSGKDLQNIANGINNAYVDLRYDVTLNDNTIVTYTISAGNLWYNGTWTDAAGNEIDLNQVTLESDAPYGIHCTMTSSNNPGNSKAADGNATIYVYMPELTFMDSTKKPEETVVFYTENYVSTVWKNGNTLSTDVLMEGIAPILTLTYTPEANCINDSSLIVTYDDFYVNVTVAIGGTDITDAVTFLHKACDPACSFDANNGEFMIHVVKVLTSLTIQKAGYSGYEKVDPNQTFLFHVEGDGVDLIVTVHGNGSVKINGLKVGSEYSVTELTDWSWRYVYTSYSTSLSHESVTNGAKVVLETDGNEITFTNTRNKNKWLDGDNWLDNLFKGN